VRHDAGRFLSTFVSDEVSRALQDVPATFREVVLLRDVEGHPYRDIAAMLGVTIGTVMSRLFRGRRLLRGKLVEYGRARGYARGAGGRARRLTRSRRPRQSPVSVAGAV
jgi:RNA polymerase sigma-70 factor (ECF subfamily)